MSVLIFVCLFIIAPLLVDLIFILILNSLILKKTYLCFVAFIYFNISILIPIWVLKYFFYDKIGKKEFYFGIIFIILFKLFVFFGASLGKIFIDLWTKCQ